MINETKNYYKVVAKCGHVGRNKYIPQTFAVKAESGEEAASRVRNFPRVKHHKKDAILLVKKINYEEYLLINELNDNNPYFKCKSKQEQNRLCKLDELIVLIEDVVDKKMIKAKRKERVAYIQKKQKLNHRCLMEKMRYVEYNYSY